MDETWLYHYDLETQQQSMEWWHSGSPRPKKFRVQKSAGKVLASIFWKQDDILLIDYLPKGQTINYQCLDHPPCSPDLAPSDYHLFPGLKKQLKGCHFSSDAEVIAATDTWLDGQPSEFFLSGLQKLEQWAMKCIELCGEYVE